MEQSQTVEKPFVWHDETHYKRFKRLLFLLILAALAVGAVVYMFSLYALQLSEEKQNGGEFVPIRGLITGELYAEFIYQAAIVTGVVSALILILLVFLFRKRLMQNFATFVLYEDRLYRLSDANRGITRMALDNSREYPDFERDFTRARKSSGCWMIEEVSSITDDGRRCEVACKVVRGLKDFREKKSFMIFPGYGDRDLLLGELTARRKSGE